MPISTNIKTCHNDMNSKITLLIPAAGYGTRVGSPPSKELMLDGQQEPLIDFSLRLAKKRDWRVHVITRADKVQLIQYLETKWRPQFKQQLSVQQILGSSEWPDTLLQSEPCWTQVNLIALPDTVFSPESILDEMARLLALGKCELVYAGTWQENLMHWGAVRFSEQQTSVTLLEKCSTDQNGWAWGLMGFDKAVGVEVLKAHLTSTLTRTPVEMAVRAELINLSRFQDLTRIGP